MIGVITGRTTRRRTAPKRRPRAEATGVLKRAARLITAVG
jgi:hypothetical protein